MPSKRKYNERRNKPFLKKPMRLFSKKWQRKRKGSETTILKVPGLQVPDSLITKFKWSGQNVGYSIAATPFFLIGINSLDPLVIDTGDGLGNHMFTGKAGGPITSFQWGGFYRNYTVFATSIKVTCYNNTADSATVTVIPCTFSPTFQATDISPHSENRYAKTHFMGANTGGPDHTTIKHYITINKLGGVEKRKVIDENNYSGNMPILPSTAATTPVSLMYWYIRSDNAALSNTTLANFRYYIELVQYTRCWTRVLGAPN